MSDSQRERMAAETIKLCYHVFILIHSHHFNLINLSSPETLHYIHLFIQLDSFTICTLVYIIITTLFLHLHFTITFRQTMNSACTHQLRLAPQYDMHITSSYVCIRITGWCDATGPAGCAGRSSARARRSSFPSPTHSCSKLGTAHAHRAYWD